MTVPGNVLVEVCRLEPFSVDLGEGLHHFSRVDLLVVFLVDPVNPFEDTNDVAFKKIWSFNSLDFLR